MTAVSQARSLITRLCIVHRQNADLLPDKLDRQR